MTFRTTSLAAITFAALSWTLGACSTSVVFVDRVVDGGTTDATVLADGDTSDVTRPINFRFGGPSVGPELAVSARHAQGHFALAGYRTHDVSGSTELPREQVTYLREMAAAQRGSEYVIVWTQEMLGRRSLHATHVAATSEVSAAVVLDPDLDGDADPEVILRNNVFVALWTRRTGLSTVATTALRELAVSDTGGLHAGPQRTIYESRRASNMVAHGNKIYGYFFESYNNSYPEGVLLLEEVPGSSAFTYTRIGRLPAGSFQQPMLRLRQTTDELLIVGWQNRVLRVPFAQLEQGPAMPLMEADLPAPLVAPEGQVVVDVFPGSPEWVFATGAAQANGELQVFVHGVHASVDGWIYDTSLPSIAALMPNRAWTDDEGFWHPHQAHAAAKLSRPAFGSGTESRVVLIPCVGGHGCFYQRYTSDANMLENVVVHETEIVRLPYQENLERRALPSPLAPFDEYVSRPVSDTAHLRIACERSTRESERLAACRISLWQGDREFARIGPQADQTRPVVVTAGMTTGVSLVQAGESFVNVDLTNPEAAISIGRSGRYSEQVMSGVDLDGTLAVQSVQQFTREAILTSNDPTISHLRRRVLYQLHGNVWTETRAYEHYDWQQGDLYRCRGRDHFVHHELDSNGQAERIAVTIEDVNGTVASGSIADPAPRSSGLWVVPWNSGCAIIRGGGVYSNFGHGAPFLSAIEIGVENGTVTFAAQQSLLAHELARQPGNFIARHVLRPQVTNAGIAVPIVRYDGLGHAAISIALLRPDSDANAPLFMPLAEFSWRMDWLSDQDERRLGFQHMASDGATILVLRRHNAVIEALRFDLNGRELFRGALFTLSEAPEAQRGIDTTGWIATAGKAPGVFQIAYQRYSSEHGAYRVYTRELRFLDEAIL